MEPIDIYDSQRRFTGRVTDRYSIHPGEYRLIAHVCVFDEEWRMLIQKRSFKKRAMPGLWDISAGGQVDAGEASHTAASRELFEELGLSRKFTEEDRVCTVTFLYGFDDYFITGSVKGDSLKLQGSEVSEASWATMDEIYSMIDDGRFVRYRKSFIKSLFDCYYRFVPMQDADWDSIFDRFDRYTEKS